MITNSDVTKLKEVFATKEDIKNFATKDDLVRFATKDDLARFATKDDLARFATKEDFRELKEEIGAIKENTQSLVTSVDIIVKTLEKQEYVALKYNDTKQDKKLQELADHTGYKFKNA